MCDKNPSADYYRENLEEKRAMLQKCQDNFIISNSAKCNNVRKAYFKSGKGLRKINLLN